MIRVCDDPRLSGHRKLVFVIKLRPKSVDIFNDLIKKCLMISDFIR